MTKKITKWILIIFVTLTIIGTIAGSSNGDSRKEITPKVTVQKGEFIGYNYDILKGTDSNKYVANFSPFLPSNDAILISMILKIINKTYEEHEFISLDPKLIERNGVNLIKFDGAGGSYYILIIKQEIDEVIEEDFSANGKEFIGHAGEIHSFIYWIE